MGYSLSRTSPFIRASAAERTFRGRCSGSCFHGTPERPWRRNRPPDGWPGLVDVVARRARDVAAIAALGGRTFARSKFPMFVAWGDELGFLYNDAYAEILGAKHPAALGAAFRDIWSEIWPDISPLIDAALAGEATYREDLPLVMNRRGYDEQTWFTFSYSPVHDESGKIAGMFCAVAETTGEVLAEQRQNFVVALGDTLAKLTDPVAMTATTAELLGQRLRVARAGYGEIDASGEIVSVARDWTDGSIASLAGEARVLDAFGPEVIAELRAGRTLRVDDCSNGSANVATGLPGHLEEHRRARPYRGAARQRRPPRRIPLRALRGPAPMVRSRCAPRRGRGQPNVGGRRALARGSRVARERGRVGRRGRGDGAPAGGQHTARRRRGPAGDLRRDPHRGRRPDGVGIREHPDAGFRRQAAVVGSPWLRSAFGRLLADSRRDVRQHMRDRADDRPARRGA